MTSRTISTLAGAIAALLLFLPVVPKAQAQDLTIGARAEIEMDPHYFWLASNVAYYRHIYGHLVSNDPKAQKIPDLAESFTPLSDTLWEFKLRDGVRFHDGSTLDAEDVVASFERVKTIPNTPSPYAGNLRGIAETIVIDPLTIHFRTEKPEPLLPGPLTQVAIIPSEIAKTATTPDFKNPATAIGAGPYKFVSYTPGEELVLTRNDDYWGEKPIWENVTFKFIEDDAARVAALLSGDVDVIDFVSPSDVARLESDSKTDVHVGPSDRTIYFYTDMARPISSQAVDKKTGEPLDPNPFLDIRVRQAISKAIDRDAMTQKVMENLATPAAQTVPPGFGGYNPDIPLVEYDPEGAKALLAEAGYPDAFGLTVACPNDRYVNDGKVCQAIGQMLARVGFDMKVDTMPKAVYFGKAGNREGPEAFSLFMLGWGSAASGEADTLWNLMQTYDKERGIGLYNHGRYSRPDFDALVVKATQTLDADERHAIEREAMAMAMKDVALIPVHYQSVIVATRAGLKYNTRADEETHAMEVTPAE